MKATQTSTQTKRFEMYTTVHKGLRAFMADTRWPPSAGSILLIPVRLQTASPDTRAYRHLQRPPPPRKPVHSPRHGSARPGSATVTTNDHVQHEEAFEHLEGEALAVGALFIEEGKPD
jgi:hypothetical protein